MFSSGKHAQVTADPQPWALASPGVFGVRGKTDGGRSGEMGWEWLYSPRPEFDRPLTNPANPILDAARLAPGANIWYANLPEWPSREQIDHASAVLHRLAKMKAVSS